MAAWSGDYRLEILFLTKSNAHFENHEISTDQSLQNDVAKTLYLAGHASAPQESCLTELSWQQMIRSDTKQRNCHFFFTIAVAV